MYIMLNGISTDNYGLNIFGGNVQDGINNKQWYALNTDTNVIDVTTING